MLKLNFSEFFKFLAKIPEFGKNFDRIVMWKVRMVRSLADRTFQLSPSRANGRRRRCRTFRVWCPPWGYLRLLLARCGRLRGPRLSGRPANRTNPGARSWVERFDRRGIEPFELFTSELGQNSVKIQYILLENSNNSGFFNIFENINICKIPTKVHQPLSKIQWTFFESGQILQNLPIFEKNVFEFCSEFDEILSDLCKYNIFENVEKSWNFLIF